MKEAGKLSSLLPPMLIVPSARASMAKCADGRALMMICPEITTFAIFEKIPLPELSMNWSFVSKP